MCTSSRSFQPARNFIVSGILIAARTVFSSVSTSGRLRSRPEPPLQLTTFFTGQPKFRSTASKPEASQNRAASHITSGSAPNNCAVMGRSEGSKYR